MKNNLKFLKKSWLNVFLYCIVSYLCVTIERNGIINTQNFKIMTTSMLKTETNVNAFGTETTYTFNVLSTETKTPITECMIVVDECDGEAYVWYSFDTYTSKQKFFKDTFEAHMYAMKVAKKIKSQYN